MNAQHPLQSLINLIEFDRFILKKEQANDTIKKKIGQLEQSHESVINERNIVQKKVQQAQKAVHENELEMKTLEEKEQEKKQQLEQSSSQKIYESLKKEITHLKKSQYDHEKQLIQSWKELESAQKELNDHLTEFTTKSTHINKELDDKKAESAVIEKELTDLYVTRKEKEHGVPQEWLDKYNVMRTQTTNPIVRVEFGSCSGCFAQLSPQALLDLHKKGLILCSSCYRFLYLPEETASS